MIRWLMRTGLLVSTASCAPAAMQPVERLAHAGIEHRVIERMVAVVVEEELERAFALPHRSLRAPWRA